jgi:hypothetical protein
MGHRVLAQMQAANMNQLGVHIHQPLMPVQGQLGLMQAADIHGDHMLVSILQYLMWVSTLPGLMRVSVLLRLTWVGIPPDPAQVNILRGLKVQSRRSAVITLMWSRTTHVLPAQKIRISHLLVCFLSRTQNTLGHLYSPWGFSTAHFLQVLEVKDGTVWPRL